MTAWQWVGVLAAAWCGVAVALALGIGKGIRIADQRATDEPDLLADQPIECLSRDEINRRFTALKPDLVTADVFSLDAQLNRRARGWVA